MTNFLLHLYCVMAAIFILPHWIHCEASFSNPRIVTRAEWGARPDLGLTPIGFSVPYVVIHHSSVPAACHTTTACTQAMRAMQDHHQLTNGWVDIGYNFGVGGDGLVYEGRGWDKVGAHSVGWNNVSIGIVLIGHWVSAVPPQNQLQATKNLINMGVALGYISPDYSLISHRQVLATECPGEALFQEISGWDRFNPKIGMTHLYQKSPLIQILSQIKQKHNKNIRVLNGF